MVNIIYMNDINDSKVDAVEYPCISDFLIENFNTRDELLDLRFFRDELLGTEINQAGGDFIDIDEGTVVVVHDSQIPKGPETWIYIIIAVTVAVATAIALKPDLPDLKNSSQKSATNRLGDTSNEPRINERIDDIFGTVSKHVVSLWQVPYRIGVNNQETEVLYTCVGRGKYAISADDWFDGDTPVKNIPNASVNVYGPNTHPSNGSPSLQIGGLINQPIGIYRQSNDLNPSELLPSNENLNRYIYWKATVNPVSPDIVVLTHVGPLPEGVNLLDIYTIGNYTNATDFVWTTQTGTLQLYLNNTGTPAKIIKLFSIPLDLSEDNTLNYEILDVTTSSVTLLVPSDASLDTKAAWASMNNYEFTKYMFKLTSSKPSSYWTDDGETDYYTYYEKDSSDTYFPIDSEQVFTDFVLGQDVQFEIGPLVVPENATEVILNFTSPSGFYKLVDNNETKIVANIRIKFVETDSNGVETGNENITDIEYKSNPDSIRRSVFKTARLNVPYTYCKLSCERTTIRDKSNNVSSVDIIEWRDFYSFEPVNVTSFGDVTTAHILIPSNSQSRLVKQRKQNVTLTRLITEYLGNGNFGSTQTFATDRFDQILIYAALDPYIGRLTLNDINAEGFLSLRTEIENYFGSNIMTKFGYDFDTTDITFQDIFTTICNAVMCVPYTQYGVYDAFFDKAQSVSSMQITCRNKIFGSETRMTNYDRKNDGVEVTYRSNQTGTTDTVYIPQDQSARNPERITLNGCTTELQAFRYACRVYNRQKYQTTTVKFEVDEFGRNVVVGRRIDSPDSTRFTMRKGAVDGYRVFDGEVVEVNGLQVELSEPVVFATGEDHYITFTKPDGDSSAPIVCTPVDDYTVLLSTLPSVAIYDGYEMDRTKFTLVSEQLQQSVALIPKTIEFSLSDDGSEVHTITSVNYTDKYYQNDLDEPE